MSNDNSKRDDFPEVKDDRPYLGAIIGATGRMWKFLWVRPKDIVRWLVYACGVLLLLDLVVLHLFGGEHHAHLHLENGIWFYAVYGFVSYALLVLIAKHLLRPAIMRDEDYYD